MAKARPLGKLTTPVQGCEFDEVLSDPHAGYQVVDPSAIEVWLVGYQMPTKPGHLQVFPAIRTMGASLVIAEVQPDSFPAAQIKIIEALRTERRHPDLEIACIRQYADAFIPDDVRAEVDTDVEEPADGIVVKELKFCQIEAVELLRMEWFTLNQ